MTNGVNNEMYEEIIEDAPVVEVPYIAPPELGDLYLKFADEASASEALEGYAGSIDIIGEIEGTTGWHVNTRGPMTEAMKQYVVIPTNPRRVWA